MLAWSAPVLGAESDIDGDGIPNSREDTNGNNIVDPGETDPRNADTDDGGEADGQEVLAGRDPLDGTDDMPADRDGDGISNQDEINAGTDWDNADTDSDGIPDNVDPFPLDREYTADTDEDGLPDEFEQQHEGLDPNDPRDAEEDTDGDGLVNRREFSYRTDPTVSDTDRDGTPDGEEVEAGEDPQESPCLHYAAPRHTFTDIGWHWAEPYIKELERIKILPEGQRLTEGYEHEGRRIFNPNQYITRFEFLKLALMSTCIQLADDTHRFEFSFTDVPSGPRPKETADRVLRRRIIYTAVRYLIVEGYPDGSFKPDQPVNRAEALKILMESGRLGPLDELAELKEFPDVPEDAWFRGYVRKAQAYDIVEGYPDGTFRPAQYITRAEAAKIVHLFMLSNPHVNGYDLPTPE